MCEVKKHNVVTTDEGIGIEIHPFNNPNDLKGARYLIVGTFPPHRFGVETKVVNQDKSILTTSEYGDEVFWFYGSKNNEMWGENGKGGLLQEVLGYKGEPLNTKAMRKKFCECQEIAFLDLFQVIKRYGDLSSDSNIFPIEIVNLVHYLEENPNIEAVLFTSTWVEQIAKKEYLRINKEKLEEAGKKTDYVERGVFYRFKNGDEVKIFTLPSPSPSNSDGIDNKKHKWLEIFGAIKNPENKE